MLSTFRLLRWLGPWASQEASPQGVDRTTMVVETETGSFDAWLYRPRGRVRGSWVLAQGLHFLGPTDPRFDRFARVLSAAGFWVFCPHIRDFMQLRVTPRALDDFAAAFDAFYQRGDRPPSRPCVWSVSFGSAMALHLMSKRRYADRVGGLMTFGGFGDWTQACLFSLTGNVEGKGPGRERDPLNQPAVFMNLLPYMEGAPENTGELCDAWLRYCRATWGNQEHKRTSSRKAVARALAEELSPGLRPLFLEGCGVGKNTQERAVRAVLDHGDAWGFLRHDGRLSHVECPVRIVHARDDDVIPVCQADVIAGHLPSGGDVRIYRTGLYGHSETSVENLRGQRISGAASEIVTMLAMVRELGTRPGRR